MRKHVDYTILKVNGRNLVVRTRVRTVYQDANFMGTSKALVGKLDEGESIEGFLARREVFSKKNDEINEMLLRGKFYPKIKD